MEKSQFENIDDKILVYVCKQILDEIDNSNNDPFDYEYDYDIYYNNIKILGFGCETIDVDYVFNIIKLNNKNLLDEDFEGPLTRPESKEYYIDIYVDERIEQTVIYRHKVSSYSDKTATDKLKFEESNGNISVWEGRHMDTSVYDSEVNDVRYSKPEIISKK